MKTWKMHAYSVLVLGLFALLAAGSDPGTSTTSTSPFSGASAPAGPSKAVALSKMNLDFTATKEGFGNILQANFTVRNGNAFAVKDIEVRCVSVAASGTVIDSNTGVIYERFDAGKIKKIKKFNMGFINRQAASTSCSIKDLVVLQ